MLPVSETLRFTVNGIVRVVILIASNSVTLKYNPIVAILDNFISQLQFFAVVFIPVISIFNPYYVPRFVSFLRMKLFNNYDKRHFNYRVYILYLFNNYDKRHFNYRVYIFYLMRIK